MEMMTLDKPTSLQQQDSLQTFYSILPEQPCDLDSHQEEADEATAKPAAEDAATTDSNVGTGGPVSSTDEAADASAPVQPMPSSLEQLALCSTRERGTDDCSQPSDQQPDDQQLDEQQLLLCFAEDAAGCGNSCS
jgi:hypothetical protein